MKKCELCSMDATHLSIDKDSLAHSYCKHHTPSGLKKINQSQIFSVLKTYRILFVLAGLMFFYMLGRYYFLSNYGLDNVLNDFMAGFFMFFGALQLNSLSSTSEALKKYDPLAQKFSWYAGLYPFVFFFFGLLLHFHSASMIVSLLTIPMLGIQTLGIINVLKSGANIECACAGTRFSLPLSYVTVVENLIMVTMSIAMIIIYFL